MVDLPTTDYEAHHHNSLTSSRRIVNPFASPVAVEDNVDHVRA